MNNLGSYLLKSLVIAALYFVLDQLLWSSGRSLPEAVVRALTFGLLMQLFNTWTTRREQEGKRPYAPGFKIALGAVGLGIYGWCWGSGELRSTDLEFYGLVGLTLLFLFVLTSGIRLAWGTRSTVGRSGT